MCDKRVNKNVTIKMFAQSFERAYETRGDMNVK